MSVGVGSSAGTGPSGPNATRPTSANPPFPSPITRMNSRRDSANSAQASVGKIIRVTSSGSGGRNRTAQASNGNSLANFAGSRSSSSASNGPGSGFISSGDSRREGSGVGNVAPGLRADDGVDGVQPDPDDDFFLDLDVNSIYIFGRPWLFSWAVEVLICTVLFCSVLYCCVLICIIDTL